MVSEVTRQVVTGADGEDQVPDVPHQAMAA